MDCFSKFMFFIININSKNLNSLNDFVSLFFSETTFKKLKINVYKLSTKKLAKKKEFAVLKSPHVNKTAQKKFKYKINKRKLILVCDQPFLFLIFLKSLRMNYMSELSISIKVPADIKKSVLFFKKNLNFEYVNFRYSKKCLIINYLMFLQVYGKFLIRNMK